MRPIWLFDLDNTLHNASPHIFPHINRSMTTYLMQHLELDEHAANRLRVDYWKRYGATLTGLMRHHGTDPHHFLHDTHQFPELERMVVFDNALRHLLRRLPGHKIVFSNGPSRYAEAVLSVMGIRKYFSDVYAVEQMRFNPKPRIKGFHQIGAAWHSGFDESAGFASLGAGHCGGEKPASRPFRWDLYRRVARGAL